MKRVLSALLTATLLCLPGASGAWLIQGSATDTGKQLLLAHSGSALANSADRYIPLGATGSGITIFKSGTFSVAGAIKSFKLTAVTQPSGAATWTATIYINGSASGATCTLTSSVAICDWTGSISVSAGDYAVILVHPSGTPSSSIIMASTGFTPTTTNDTVILSSPGTSTFSTSAANYVQPFDASLPGTLATARRTGVFPDGGTLDKFYINSVAPGSGKSYAYTIFTNGTGSTVTATISNAATSNNDTSHSVSVSAGDYVNFEASPSGTPTASDAGMGARYLATTAGRYPYVTSNVSDNGSATLYMTLNGNTTSTTEANVQNITHSQTFEKLQVKFGNAPGTAGSGKKYTVTLRKNGSNTALTCDVLNTATTCSASGTVAVNDNDLVGISIVPTSTPSAVSLGTGLLATR